MQTISVLALIFMGGAFAAPAALSPAGLSDFELTIRNTQEAILMVINDIAQQRDASSNFGTTGRWLDNLRTSYFPAACPQTTSLPAPATSREQAIQYLQQVQLDLSIATQDAINGATANATNDICGAVNLYNAGVANFANNVHSSSALTALSPTFTSTSASASPTSTDCQSANNVCRTAPNANMAYCASQFSACESKCSASYDTCRTAPDANMAYCASQYAGCLGYNFLTASASASPAPTASTSSSVLPISTGCQTQQNACRTAPSANQAYCSSQAAACQGVCSSNYNTCRTAPNANQAYCASQYAGCLGYNPFAASTSTSRGSAATTSTSTSAPASGSGNCLTQENICRTAPNANQAYCSSQAAACKNACENSWEACKSGPNPNQSFCGSQYAVCLGYNPFAASATATPTSGSATVTVTSTSTSTSATPSNNCQSQENACRTGPNANQSYCSSQAAACENACENSWEACKSAPDPNQSFCGSQYAVCLGYNPFSSTTASATTTSLYSKL